MRSNPAQPQHYIKVCQWLTASKGFLQILWFPPPLYWPPQYDWNIIEHHQTNRSVNLLNTSSILFIEYPVCRTDFSLNIPRAAQICYCTPLLHLNFYNGSEINNKLQLDIFLIRHVIIIHVCTQEAKTTQSVVTSQ